MAGSEAQQNMESATGAGGAWPRAATEHLLDMMPQAVVLLDLRARIIKMNSGFRQLFGEGEPGQSLFSMMDSDHLRACLEGVASTGAAAELPDAPVGRTGATALICHIRASRVGTGARAKVLVVIQDETAARDQRERMIASSRLVSVGEMAAGVAHELNNPLTAILGFSQLAVRQDVDDVLKHDLDAIATEAERAGRIVDNLLSFARSHNSGDRVFDAAASIRKILDLREYECRVNNIEVVTYLDPDTPRTVADTAKMEQVLLNLLANAVQAIADGPGRGTITVGLVAIDGKVRISFTDDGPGIPPHILPRIFDPFFTTKPVGKGTGLGLSICQSIVKENGGEIRAESRLRRGTTFVVEIPLVEVAETGPEKSPAPARAPVSYTMLRILVVDDEPAVVEMIARALGGIGHHVDTCRDGAEAVRMVHLNDYDAILLDIKMPGLGGPAVYRCIQGLRPELTRRVLFMTGDTVSPDTRFFIEGAGAEILHKPFSLDELRQRMDLFAGAKDERTAAAEQARRPDLAAGFARLPRPVARRK